MKVFLSTDIEGTAGIADWSQVLGPGAEYELGRRLLQDEVNAAIDGALEAGADELVVNDSHYLMLNLLPAELHGEASLLSGKHKPLYMMEGLDDSFAAALFISYHGSIGARTAILSHTYNPNCISEVRLNGTVTGEAGINALVALHHRVPVALITGDEVTGEEARPFMPQIEAVTVKRSVSRFAAESLHPQVACRRIREGARRALERLGEMSPPAIELPARLDVVMRVADMAEMATWVGGVERTGERTIAITDDDPLALYRRFVTVVAPDPRSGPGALMAAAVVTGAAGAIGAAVAARLAADGFDVLTTDVAGDVDERCDLRDEAAVAALRDAATARLGPPSMLVNVAGVFFEHDVPDTTVEQYDEIMDVNVKGTFLACRAFLPAMIAAGSGCIINIASVAGLRGGHRRAVYNASKAAAVLFTRCLALDHGPQGVRVNCICPGLIDTPMADWITSRPQALQAWEQTIPARRIGTAEDIAAAVSWLAGDQAGYLHGSVLSVDGGDTA